MRRRVEHGPHGREFSLMYSTATYRRSPSVPVDMAADVARPDRDDDSPPRLRDCNRITRRAVHRSFGMSVAGSFRWCG
jgi:hypothetical protein